MGKNVFSVGNDVDVLVWVNRDHWEPEVCWFLVVNQSLFWGIQTHKNIWISTPAVGIWPVTNHPISILCHWTSMVAGWECSSPPFSSAANLLCVWESGTWRSSAKWPYNALHIFLCIYYILYIYTHQSHMSNSRIEWERYIYYLEVQVGTSRNIDARKLHWLPEHGAWQLSCLGVLFGRQIWLDHTWPPQKVIPKKRGFRFLVKISVVVFLLQASTKISLSSHYIPISHHFSLVEACFPGLDASFLMLGHHFPVKSTEGITLALLPPIVTGLGAGSAWAWPQRGPRDHMPLAGCIHDRWSQSTCWYIYRYMFKDFKDPIMLFFFKILSCQFSK